MTDLAPLRERLDRAIEAWHSLQQHDSFTNAVYDALSNEVRAARESLIRTAKANAVEAFQDAGEFIPNWESAE